MSQSILTSVKKALGLEEDYTPFDVDIIMHINSVFSVLRQLGVGPKGGFAIEDKTATWESYISENTPVFNMVRSYMYLKVRLLFDRPETSFAAEALEKTASEYEWRLMVAKEEVDDGIQ